MVGGPEGRVQGLGHGIYLYGIFYMCIYVYVYMYAYMYI